jgi:hypothetical protein
MKKIISLSLIITLSTTLILAQENHKKCITTKLVAQELKDNNNYAKARENAQLLKGNSYEKITITIPVVIHIIHRQSHPNIGSGTNIPNIQIEDALRILNEDFSKTNPEFPNPPRDTFLNYWGNPDLEFCLATTDPNGNSTSGITRTATAQTNWDADNNTESNAMKQNSSGGRDSWDPKKYLNIWVCDLINSQGGGQTLGYAYLPGLLSGFGQNAWKDGLVVDYRYFGTNGIAAPSSDGRTATHEIGHYLGLNHTFSEDNYPTYSCLDNNGNTICCDRDGGNVDDTPATDGVYWGNVTSTTNNNTCNDLAYANAFTTDVLDMDENFMSYATATWMFSQGQVDVMMATLNTSEMNGGRSSLKNSNISTNCSGIISSTLNELNEKISIYPNPSNGNLFISTSEVIKSIKVTNIIGKEIYSSNNFNDNSIDLINFNNGVYFIDLSTEKGTITKKITLTK